MVRLWQSASVPIVGDATLREILVVEVSFPVVFAFLFGLCIGSFLNVCIARLPRGVSIILPASHCPKCGTPIRPLDNIPLVSWLVLGGRCRAPNCRQPISIQYPLVELCTGLLFAATVWWFGVSLDGLKWLVLFCLLTVHIVTDLRERYLSFRLNQIGIAAGLVFSLLAPVDDGAALALSNRFLDVTPPEPVLGLVDALLGAALGGGLLWLVAEGYFRLTKRQGMGLGDVYLMLMIGAFLGLKRTFLTILGGSLLGSVIGTGLVLILFATGWRRATAERAARRGLGGVTRIRFALARRYPLPFGTYLGLAAILAVFFGWRLIMWYASLGTSR